MFLILIFCVNLGFGSSRYNASTFFEHFHKYNEIVTYLQYLQNQYPDKMKLISIGITHENRVIPAVTLSSYNTRKIKSNILIDAGMHSREWISTAVAIYLIYQLVQEENEGMLSEVEWIIVPLLNPDGYEYSHLYDRLWRKNRAPGVSCVGVDINRNFDNHWGEEGASNNECSNIYAGKKPFSEPESQALRELVLRYHPNIEMYLSLHSYGNKIIYPYGHKNISVSADFEKKHDRLGLLVAQAIKNVRNTVYKVGRLSSLLYVASGISSDWIYDQFKIPLTYSIELSEGFRTSKKEIVPTGIEIFNGLKEYFVYITNNDKYINKQVHIFRKIHFLRKTLWRYHL